MTRPSISCYRWQTSGLTLVQCWGYTSTSKQHVFKSGSHTVSLRQVTQSLLIPTKPLRWRWRWRWPLHLSEGALHLDTKNMAFQRQSVSCWSTFKKVIANTTAPYHIIALYHHFIFISDFSILFSQKDEWLTFVSQALSKLFLHKNVSVGVDLGGGRLGPQVATNDANSTNSWKKWRMVSCFRKNMWMDGLGIFLILKVISDHGVNGCKWSKRPNLKFCFCISHTYPAAFFVAQVSLDRSWRKAWGGSQTSVAGNQLSAQSRYWSRKSQWTWINGLHQKHTGWCPSN